MRAAVEFHCEQHSSPFECPDALVHYSEVFDEYGIIIHDGGPSYSLIQYCPWCGAKLPESQRDRYFAELDALGIEYDFLDDETLPEKYRTAAWRKQMQ
ncbi:MAG: hypothetical protein AB7U38_14675 [Hyphomicrobiales bacterium]